jgi:uncharacterized metal-binding protein YceD (DUF177 family)
MQLDVTQALLRPGDAFPFEAKVAVPPQTVDRETVTFGEVALKGTYSAMDGAVVLTGSLRAKAYAACAMCLEPVEVPMELEFRETFRKDAVETEDEDFHFEGSAVTLDHLTLTLLMLNLPMRFLCEENCDGKETQTFGSIFNSSCQEDSPRPFEALKRLLKEDEEV